MALCIAYNTKATIQSPARNESRHLSIHSAPRDNNNPVQSTSNSDMRKTKVVPELIANI